MRSLRIVVADDEPDMQDYFQRMLPRLGHRVVATVGSGPELIEQCRLLQPDLVMTDIQMPGMDGIEAAAQVYRERPLPVILVSAHHDTALVERAEADHILGYLVKPIKQSDLEPVIAVAVRRFAQVQALQEALSRVQQLQGMLPICTYCKKIRDDHNYWQQVETYITIHSAARFSHSICPDCYDSLVKPELDADLPVRPQPHSQVTDEKQRQAPLQTRSTNVAGTACPREHTAVHGAGASQVTSSSFGGGQAMTGIDVAKYRARLTAIADRLSREVEHLEVEAAQATGGEGSGGLSDAPTHPAELSSREFEEEVTLGLVEQEERLLAEVVEGLERIDRGIFGRCESCQATIGQRRLRALPYARHCLDCARTLEQSAAQR